ncbi:MAG: addiction module protein [Pyrinomonadaceae bacterium]
MSNDKRNTDDADWQAAAYEQFVRDDADADLVYEEEWAAEVERRQAEVESGKASFLSGPKTLVRLKSEFQ